MYPDAEMEVFLQSADFLFFLTKYFKIKGVKPWSKQVGNEGI